MKKFSRAKIIIILILIIAFQVGVRIFAGNQKEYFHMDEMYSYGLMNYDKTNIADNENLMNSWHAPEYFRDYLEVNSDEKFDFSAVYENQKNDVHPPLFYLFLRVFSSFNIDNFSKWSGIILNIFLFVFSAILLFLIAKKITRDDKISLAILFFAGLIPAALDATIYIRMYEFAALNILLISYFSFAFLDAKKVGLREIFGLGFSLIFGALTHYHFFFFAAPLMIFCAIFLIKSRRKIDLKKFILTVVISAIIALLIFPPMISQLISGHPDSSGFFNNFFVNFRDYILLFNGDVLANFGAIFLLIIFAIFVLKLMKILAKKFPKFSILNFNLSFHFDKNLWILLLCASVYFVAIVATAPWVELRYIMPISMIFALIFLAFFAEFFKNFFGNFARKIVYFFLIILLISNAIFHPNLEMTYENYNKIAEKVRDFRAPILYIFDVRDNRFLDDIYLLTFENSYILEDENVDEKTLEKVFSDAKINDKIREKLTVVLDQDDAKFLPEILEKSGFSRAEKVQKMNATNVYFLQ